MRYILILFALLLACSQPAEPPANVIAGVGSYAVRDGGHYHITAWVDTTQASDYLSMSVIIDQWIGWQSVIPGGAERLIFEFETPPNIGEPGGEYLVRAHSNNETIEQTGILP
ncbi:MAG: hypothetical protein PHE17_19205 [Thiothrix sp.]|jgi:hypothetical protein|uniref:hypothetical protein n=1 Tax=Thiothrix sp. TaxID=1032 RepID=UPI0026346B80|nr:hypothetical protein [Thiothrix sp.]MDD5395155.1 hypothetical protein [Thiothrix sp.]